MQRRIELLDDTELLQQLRNLREENNRRGHFDVRPSQGKDDRAVALALLVHQARSQERALPFEIVPLQFQPSPAFLGLIPETCPLQAVCLNCPRCIDEEHSLTYLPDPGLVQIST